MIPRCHTIPTPYIVGPVHCYSTELDGELTLFDCGPPTEECRRFLQENLDLSRLKNLILTHGHIDHWGQMQWLAQQGVRVFLPRADMLKITRWEERRQAVGALVEEVGFPPGWRRRFDTAFVEDCLYRELPPGCEVAEDALPERFGLRIHSCPGHSVSDLVYEGDGWIVSGDTLLDGIFQSPVLDVAPDGGGRFDNYSAWCESLVRLAALDGCTVLPGHREGGRVTTLLNGWLTTLLYRTERFKPLSEMEMLPLLQKLLAGRLKGPFHLYLKASEVVFLRTFLDNPALLRQALQQAGLYGGVAEAFERVVG